ncbi:MAG: hypothetical protein RIM84_09020 [Alphaproteobacteria bacterium]
MSAQQHAGIPTQVVTRRVLFLAALTAVLAACGKKGKLRRKTDEEKQKQ